MLNAEYLVSAVSPTRKTLGSKGEGVGGRDKSTHKVIGYFSKIKLKSFLHQYLISCKKENNKIFFNFERVIMMQYSENVFFDAGHQMLMQDA